MYSKILVNFKCLGRQLLQLNYQVIDLTHVTIISNIQFG